MGHSQKLIYSLDFYLNISFAKINTPEKSLKTLQQLGNISDISFFYKKFSYLFNLFTFQQPDCLIYISNCKDAWEINKTHEFAKRYTQNFKIRWLAKTDELNYYYTSGNVFFQTNMSILGISSNAIMGAVIIGALMIIGAKWFCIEFSQ